MTINLKYLESKGIIVYMSIIMAVGDKHKLILASDGRVSDIDDEGNHIILDESFKKIFRINSSVYVLTAGDRKQCMEIIHMLQDKIVSVITPQLCTDTIYQFLQNGINFMREERNIQMIIAGFNFFKERELYLLSADIHSVKKEKISLNDNTSYVAKGDIDKDETDYFLPILNVKYRDIKSSIKLCIAEASKRKNSVNNVVFFEEL